jgi:hypothetical protein
MNSVVSVATPDVLNKIILYEPADRDEITKLDCGNVIVVTTPADIQPTTGTLF